MLFTLSSIGTALAGSFAIFVANRLLGGVAIGLASNLSPMYIAEIAPAAIRGKLVSINQLTIVIGILLAQVVNWLIAEPSPPARSAEQILASWNGQVGWRWMFGVTAVPAFLFFVGDVLRAREPAVAGQGRPRGPVPADPRPGSAARLTRGGAGRDPPDSGDRHGRPGRLPRAARPAGPHGLVLGVVLAVFQQWCGINVIFNYAEEIFASAGYGVSDILFNIVITGIVNLVFTFVAIAAVDRLGRRFLMLRARPAWR